MNDVLMADDPLYRELYDGRREGEILGNPVEQDMNQSSRWMVGATAPFRRTVQSSSSSIGQ